MLVGALQGLVAKGFIFGNKSQLRTCNCKMFYMILYNINSFVVRYVFVYQHYGGLL